MRLSDARTRGPWRKKWVQFIRANDIIKTLEKAIWDTQPDGWEKLHGALALALEERAKIVREIERALTVGPDDPPKKSQVPCHGGNGDAPS